MLIVALLNLTYFGIEFAVALAIGSVSLFADSVDFLEDASVNLLILMALGWSLKARARVGMGLAGILLVPALATVWAIWTKVGAPLPPAPIPMTLTGFGRTGRQSHMRRLVGALSTPQWQSDACGIPVGTQRCLRQHRDHHGRSDHGVHVLGVARSRGGPWHHDHECRRGA